MITYRCPGCGKRCFDAEAFVPVRIEMKCGRCDAVMNPEPAGRAEASRPWHRTLRCTRCRREQFVERPVNDRMHCVVCGTRSLVIVAETGEAPARPGPRVPVLAARRSG